MKRILSLLGLSLALLLFVAACGTEAPSRPETDAQTQVALGNITPTVEATEEITEVATEELTEEPTLEPTVEPTTEPTIEPTLEPTVEPTTEPTIEPTVEPTEEATEEAAVEVNPTNVPSGSSPSEEEIAANVASASAERGEEIFTVNAIPTCTTCHSTDGVTMTLGPNLAGIRERAGEAVAGEGAYTYVYNSIRYSQMHIAEGGLGGAGIMPVYDGVLNDQDVYNLIAYLWTLGE